MKTVKNLDELILALGLKPGDEINIMTSPHKRDYDLEIDFIPQTKQELQAIIDYASTDNLVKMGVGCFSRTETFLKPGEALYLFPGEWYKYIPEGFPIISIFGQKEKFKSGVTDDDCRFGCLPYGFIRKEVNI